MSIFSFYPYMMWREGGREKERRGEGEGKEGGRRKEGREKESRGEGEEKQGGRETNSLVSLHFKDPNPIMRVPNLRPHLNLINSQMPHLQMLSHWD